MSKLFTIYPYFLNNQWVFDYTSKTLNLKEQPIGQGVTPYEIERLNNAISDLLVYTRTSPASYITEDNIVITHCFKLRFSDKIFNGSSATIAYDKDASEVPITDIYNFLTTPYKGLCGVKRVKFRLNHAIHHFFELAPDQIFIRCDTLKQNSVH